MSWEMGEKGNHHACRREGENTHERQGGWNLNVKTAKQRRKRDERPGPTSGFAGG